jgi:hypothetical protein
MANKFGNKMAPNDPDLPKALRTVQSQSLAGSPKAPTVGPFDNAAGKPPVAAKKRGVKGKRINS